MRHATREVLGRDFADEELMQAVGGPGLEAQMAAFAPERVDELVRVYRAHNEPLHDELEALRRNGRRARPPARARGGGSASSRRSAARPSSSRSRACPLAHLFETVVGGDETERHKPDPEPLLLAARAARARDRRRAAYVGDSPFDIRAAKAAGDVRGRGHLGRGSTTARALEREEPDAIVDTAEELLERL